jgi:hypothetical protein
MKKILNCLKFICILLCFPTFVFADEYIELEEDSNVSANIEVDNFSSITVDPSTIEIGMEADVTVQLLDYLGGPISNHSVRLYIDGDDTGITITQPLDSDPSGEATGKIKSSNADTYKVRAVDDTYGYDIDITDFDLFYTTLLLTPELLEENQYTKGTRNTLKWIRETGYEYFVECSKTSTFTTVEDSSGWISASQYTFSDLEDEQIYFYRLKKRNTGGGESSWSDIVYSVQDATAPTIELIEIQNMNKTPSTGDDFIEIQAKIQDNLSLISQTTYCVLTNGGLYECASYSKLTGSIYVARIPFDELEKDSLGNLLNTYSFCIEADDEAGNINRECDIEIVLKEETAIGIVEPEDEEFSFRDITFRSLTYLPYTVVDNMVSTMNDIQISITALMISTLVFLTLLSLYFGNIWLAILSPIYILISAIRSKKEYLLRGVIYDSVTKHPLKFALIKILNKDGKKISWGISDEYGEFEIYLNEKDIQIYIVKNGYIFPSSMDSKTDYPYINIYKGGDIAFKESKDIYVSIPLDIKHRLYFVQKLTEGLRVLMYIFLLILFSFSVFLSLFILTQDFSSINFLILCLTVLDSILILKILFKKVKKLAIVKDEEGIPVSGVTVVVKDFKSKKIKEKRVTSKDGKYFFNLKEGEYVLDILNKDLELIAVEEGRNFKIKDSSKDMFGRDLIVEKR